MDLLIPAAAFVFGLIIGSYLNVCIYRIPRHISTAAGRSFCPNCRKTIAWYDLVPVASYIVLRGRCRYCSEKISPRYMLVELLTGVCFFLAALVFGPSVQALLACAVLGTLIPVAFIDAEEKIIPDRFVIILLILGLANMVLSGEYVGHIIGFFAVSLPFLIIALVTGGMGGGDIKLMAAAGLYLGWAGALLSVILGSVFGAAVSVYLLVRKKAGRKSEIPFGPFLAFGIAMAVLFGDRIIAGYLAWCF